MSITPEGTSADAPIIAAQAEAVKPRKPKEREYVVFGAVDAQGVDGNAWEEIGRATVTGIFDEKMRDEAEAQVTDKLPPNEQGGPFVTIAASAWQPREYETETITRRKPKAVK